MPIVTFVEFDGTRHEVELSAGLSLMDGAVRQGLQGMTGECSGSMACGTCHCFIDEAWLEQTGAPSELERDLLENSPVAATTASRLGCQVHITDQHEGLIVYLPESQY